MGKEIKKAYFIGIGGAGMSGIAKVMREMGLQVSGSDIKESANIDNLRKLGVKIHIGHKGENLDSTDVVISSTAIPQNNKELQKAKKEGLTIWPRAKALAYVAKDKKTIAVCGTHGKTTTTSMISLLLEKSGFSPTFLIGGELNDIGSNAKYGKGEWLVAEADESDGSLVHIKPHILVLTNVEADHLDYFKDYDEIKELFKKFVSQVPEDGVVIYNSDFENLKEIIHTAKSKAVSFGFNKEADFVIKQKKASGAFSLSKNGKRLGDVNLKVTGKHNVYNASAALVTSIELGRGFKNISQIINSFSGVHRRFEKIPTESKISIYDDYAHHPTEIKATLSTAKDTLKGRVICVFQPHRYSRTRHLKKLFRDSFDDADVVVLTDVYPAGEQPVPGITGKILIDELLDGGKKHVVYMPTLQDAADYIKDIVREHDNLITMGAGDISQVARQVAQSVAIY